MQEKNVLAVLLVLVVSTGAFIHSSGNSNASVHLVMFSDLECPLCVESWNTLLEGVLNEYSDTLYFKFVLIPYWQNRNDPDVCLAAEAMASLVAEDDFWRIFDYFFNRSNEYSNVAFANKTNDDLIKLLRSYAAYLNISDTSFMQVFQSEQIINTISANINEGVVSGISTVPSFVINGALVSLDNFTAQGFIRAITLAKQKNNITENEDLSSDACQVYWGFMIIFIVIGIVFFVAFLVMCINSRVNSIEKEFNPGKLWETVTIGDISKAPPTVPGDTENGAESDRGTKNGSVEMANSADEEAQTEAHKENT